MGKSKTGGGWRLGAATCHFCGRSLSPTARFCAECNRYQPRPGGSEAGAEPPADGAAGFATRPCRICGELIPAASARCHHCESFQRGLRRLLPVSAATISALGALVAMVTVLISTYLDVPKARSSETSLEIFQQLEDGLRIRLTNTGNAPSFVGKAWMHLASECPWSADDPPDLCKTPGAFPPAKTIELIATSPKAAFVSRQLIQ